MSKFLNDFLITMPGTQRNMLLQLLQEKENNGLIRSENEFKKDRAELNVRNIIGYRAKKSPTYITKKDTAKVAIGHIGKRNINKPLYIAKE